MQKELRAVIHCTPNSNFFNDDHKANYRVKAGVYGLIELAVLSISTSILLVTSFNNNFSILKFVLGVLGFCLAGFPMALLVGLLHRNKYMFWIYLVFNCVSCL
uniref:Uncharacterized protein n=1 Tax=Ditylenchus dipsaci TaxID=166011 RepID=A0A915CYH7_9BILA